ncbi:hypothetical protein QNO07_26355 [Streptomyces sp. 549]|uniref:trypsin-like serine peptidase n=1 Tax=Streptomyces sp. 549 TaxID=3049076 RepID=UPI0024C413D2|nr:hypothetical protein [Streptomyces sp. 549]MDK1476881.1 hypothetical protein [Streptomyces sp. 549]
MLSPRIRRVLAAGAAGSLLALAAACGSAPGEAGGPPSPRAGDSTDLDRGLPTDLPDALGDLGKWKDGGWNTWDREKWLREAADFVNPHVKGLWDADRMHEAEESHPEVTDEELAAASADSDPEPAAVRAEQVRTPYHQNAAPVGKVFFDTPRGPMVCSGTVVQDPRNPGRSDLVATAGHCVHGGRNEGWYRNIMFVPSYNDEGHPAEQVGDTPQREVAPYGIYWAQWAQTTSYWIDRGDAAAGAAGAAQDFAVLRVQSESGEGQSLEETVGNALKINFEGPQPDRLEALSSYGYPAAPPFDGALMHTCTDAPGRLFVDPSQPPMYRIGCTMTGGTSGGGMYIAGARGKAELVSVNAIGPQPATWLAGPYLGEDAKGVFDAVSKQHAGRS